VRYPTTGANLPENIQPLNFQFQDHSISIAHNGNLVNTAELRAAYEQAGQIFTTTTDTEIIARILIDEITSSGRVEDAVALCMKRMQGSYSTVMMIDGVIYAFRDPLGIKPFCLGKLERGYIVASESVAVDALGGKFLRTASSSTSILPGQTRLSTGCSSMMCAGRSGGNCTRSPR
jgi:amidophosphoribosyltransferase